MAVISATELAAKKAGRAKRIHVKGIRDQEDVPLYVDIVKKAMILPKGLAIVARLGGGKVLAESCLRTSQLDQLLADAEQVSTCSVRPGRWLCLNDTWAHGYYHWLSEQLPRVILAEAAGFDGMYVIPKGGAFIRQSLRLLGIDPTRLVVHDGTCWVVDELYLPKLFTGAYLPFHIGLFSLMRQRLIQSVSPNKPWRRLYIKRESTSRSIVNEDELQILLSDYDVKTVIMENHCFEEQVCMAAESELLIGPLGSGMTNCIFMSCFKSIIELFPPTYTIAYQIPFANILGLRYHMVTSPKPQESPYNYGDCIVAYLSMIDNNLMSCLGRPRRRRTNASYDDIWK